MPTWKVAYFSGVGGRAEFMIEQAPPNLEVTVVDPELPDEEKTQLCRDADAIISSNISTDVLGQCPNVKLVQTLSAGYDRLDLEAILEMGIPVANNGGANAIAVAEHSIALMINIGKRLMDQWNSSTLQRQWRGDLYLEDLSELTDKTVGIVGLGRIGKHLAKRLTGFDTHTIYYDIEEIPQEVQRELKAEPVPFDDLLRMSDIISLHVPLTRRTRGMMSDREFEMMKPTAYLINACRGPVVDEAALLLALPGHVRSDHHVFHVEQGILDRRGLLLQHIQTGEGYLPGLQCSEKGCLVHYRTTAGIYQVSRRLHHLEFSV